MKPMTFSTIATLTFAAGLTAGLTTVASAGIAAENFDSAFQVAQSSRAEQTCVAAARDRGLRVQDVVSVNEHSGGAEVIMEVRRQGRNSSLQVGCDYSSATRDVELYEIEDGYNSSDDNNDDNWRNQYSGGDVRNRSSAESIAREAVRDQLGIDDPYSSVVEIDDVEQNNRSWVVEGRANGAPFIVRIRANDGSVQDFQLR